MAFDYGLSFLAAFLASLVSGLGGVWGRLYYSRFFGSGGRTQSCYPFGCSIFDIR